MKLADRLKFTANGTSAATITVGAAVAACRTLAQAIADGALVVGDTNVPFTVTDGAAWEDSLFTVTSTTQLTRTSVLASSAGGTTAATFGGPLTVFNAVPGAILSRVVFDSDVPFSQSVPLTQPGTAWMTQQTVGGALNFTPAANAVKGAYAYVRLVADGVNVPTWTGFTEEIGSAGYDNRNGIINRLQFSYDGSDYWVAVSQALNAVAVAAAASALTLTLSSASVVPGSPVTVTVGTDSPLTGSQTESVTLTAPVAGTWSANPVTLNASTATATPTFTPSATGSGNITAAASGTPTLTGASVALTVTSAPVAPGAPTIGTATAGDTTASFPFTAPASNGGATITGYTLTVYNASTNAVVGTFSGTTSPISATGLTDGTGYYGKVAATNSAGTGSQSAASNTVTPAAAGGGSTSNLRFSQLANATESGTGPYTYTGLSTAAYSSAYAESVLHMQSGVDGSMDVVNVNSASGGFIYGLTTSTTPVPFASLHYSIYAPGGTGNYGLFVDGALVTATTAVAAAAGDVMRIERVGSVINARISKDNGTTWTTIYQWTAAPTTSQFYFEFLFNGATSLKPTASTGLA